jgi:hypothetical protein
MPWKYRTNLRLSRQVAIEGRFEYFDDFTSIQLKLFEKQITHNGPNQSARRE